MAEGEILEEEAVTPEEVAATQEGEGEIRTPHMTNFRDNNPPFSKEIDANRRHSCRSGASIGASIDSPHK